MIIGIIHHKSTQSFLKPLLKSLKGTKYPIVVVHNDEFGWQDFFPMKLKEGEVYTLYNPKGGFELGALKALMDVFAEDDFFMLQESTLIKDQEIFDIANEFKGSLAMCPGFGSFLGKYRREILEKVGIPIPQDRQVAIYYEKYWNEIYMNTEPIIASCDEPLVDTKKFVMRNKRKNMVLENKYMKKWKSNWQGFKINIF